MSFFIAFAGKGGTGKSSLSAITVRFLVERGFSPTLAVDADPNYCLPELLGVQSFETLAEIRERINERKPEGVTLDEWLEFEINRAISEAKGFDLLVMGRPEGRGCYCAVNNVLRRVLEDISSKYRFVVVDNEAGMEHISRGLVKRVDTLFVISIASKSSIQAAERILDLSSKLGLNPSRKVLIINQTLNGSSIVKIQGSFDCVYTVSYDQYLRSLSERGEDIFRLSGESACLVEFYKVLEEEIERKV